MSGPHGTIQFSWNAISGATQYQVYVMDEIHQIAQPLYSGFVTTNSITINNMPIYDTLKYYVLPYKGTVAAPLAAYRNFFIPPAGAG